MKKAFLLFWIALLAAAPLLAQNSPCYDAAISEGERLFNKGKYTEAKTFFKEALNCPDPDKDKANEWIKKCNKALAGEKTDDEGGTGQGVANLKKALMVIDSLDRVILEKDKMIKYLEDSHANGAELIRELRKRDSIITIRQYEIEKLEKDASNIHKKTANLEKQFDKTKAENEALKQELMIKNHMIDSLNGNISNLTKQIKDLKASNKQYQKAFKETETTINRIYTANGNKRLADMNVSELSEAENAWNGMKALIEATDQTLAKQLKQKVDEISLWKSAVKSMRGARDYMKGKYDNNQRLSWIKKLNNLKLNGDKASERNEMVTALMDQESIKEVFNMIVDDKLAPEKCLPDAASLRSVKSAYETAKNLDKNFYHDSCYDNYDAAIRKIEAELNKSEPSNKVKDPDSYQKFIKELREMF